jgi:hypothetical protein
MTEIIKKRTGVKPGVERKFKNYKWRVSYQSCITDEVVEERFLTTNHILRHPLFSKFFKSGANVGYYSITPETERFVKVFKINEPVEKLSK